MRRDEVGEATTLDPDDWTAFRTEAHRALDMMIDHIRTIRDRPVWRPAPEASRRRFQSDAPQEGRGVSAVLDDVVQHIEPYVVGNLHPLFLGWVHGAGTPVGMISEMVAAGLNANCGGRNHIAIDVEQQMARWVATAFGFPADASGIFVTGASAGNFRSLVVARHRACAAIRDRGARQDDAKLVAYASIEAHDCIQRAMSLAGLGVGNLRLIGTGADYRVDTDALIQAIALDIERGFTPFLLVGNAGTVNTGAIDDLGRLAEIAQAMNLWFHVDGAFGALAAFSAELKPRLRGMERADSVAFDFHKWFHVPYDAGFFLVRDPEVHRAAFATKPAYLSREARGLAAGSVWPCDLGMDLSRGFRALKTWMTIEVLGIKRLARSMERTCELAQYLRKLIDDSVCLEMRAPVSLNIVCFALRDDPTGDLARTAVMEVQERGEAAPSLTTLNGISTIRAAIVNHRTRHEDVLSFFEIMEAAARRRRKSSKRSLRRT